MALLLIPLVSLTAIWVVAAAFTVRAVFDRPDVDLIAAKVVSPTEDVLGAVREERKAALLYTAESGDARARVAYQREIQATDSASARLRTDIDSGRVRAQIDGQSRRGIDTLLSGLQGLTAVRQQVNGGHASSEDVYSAYDTATDTALNLFEVLDSAGIDSSGNQRHGVAGLARAVDQTYRQDALLNAALASGTMTRRQLTDFTFAVAQERGYEADSLGALDAQHRAPLQSFLNGAQGRRLAAAQNAIIDASPAQAPAVAAKQSWPTLAGSVLDSQNGLVNQGVTALLDDARPVPTRLLVEAGLAGGLGLIAVVGSVVISVRIGRSLIRDLSGLRRDAQEVSGSRLPRVMRRLAAGEQVDIEAETPRPSFSDDEIGQVGQALHHLERAAVEAAVRQAEMRRGVSDVFVNLARRSQVLLHRQLTLLDAMERRTEDAEELADLFRLDHMTTRMRRHAEGLVILSGAAASRQWRRPVQLMDVVRAAVAEVEEYERVEVRRLPKLAVVGAAVADLTHLLAELIENAAVFSPPHTQVVLHGEPVANGFVLEVDDRGLGLAPDALLEANLRLAETPEFELSDTDRLGLFVVSRLAQRQGVRVSLRPSPYGGTTAVVLIPANLLAETDEDTGSTPLEPEERRVPRQTGDGVRIGFRGRGPERPGGDRPDARPGPRHAAGEPEAPAAPGGPVVLPRRRRGTAVLVSDHGRPVNQPEDRAAARQPGDFAPAAESPAVAIPAPAPAEHTRPDGGAARDAARPPAPRPDAPAGGSALPRRVRQANLAPQLRAAAADAEQRRAEEAAGRERTADEVRDRMASLQRGWLRGRGTDTDTEDADGSGGGHGRDRPEPGGTSPTDERTTPEGNGR